MTGAAGRFNVSWRSLSQRKDLGAWLLKYGAVLLAFLFFFVPLNGRLSSYLAERRSLKKEIMDLRHISTDLLTPPEIQRVKERVDLFEGKLADPTKAAQIVDQISEIAEKNHLKMVQIYSNSPLFIKDDTGKDLEVGGRKLSLLPVNFRVEADLKNLANFLKALNDDSQWIFTVESLELQKPSADAENLQCDITLSYFAL